MKIINLPPFAPILMESTRAIGYSIDAAIADIIDNSITAKATQISVCFLPYDDPFIAILDNGIGMSSERLTESMRYGSNNSLDIRDENDLGRYGLGLKTASLSQCRCLTVITLYKAELLARRWDLDYINKTGRWDLIELEGNEIIELPIVDKLLKQKKGTLVIWSRLDNIKAGEITLEQALGNRMEEVMDHLSLVFHRYLSGDGVKKISITINENEVKAFDPFFSTKSTVIMDDEKIHIPGRNENIVVRPFVLPHPSKMTKEELEKYGGKDGLRKLQGFYIYRNKRLLTWGTWFRVIKMDEFSKLARVRVDIPNSLDDLWSLDIKKSTAYPPEVVKIRLKQIVGTISNSSKKTWTFRRKKETDDNISHIWNRMNTREGIRYFINQDHPLLELVNERIDKVSQKMLKEYIETIQNNIPINTLHSDIHNESKIVQDDEKTEKKRVCILARALLEAAKSKDELERTYAGFEIVEPFNDYINEINDIYLEVKIDG
jgi:hypothetical protein